VDANPYKKEDGERVSGMFGSSLARNVLRESSPIIEEDADIKSENLFTVKKDSD
jgi:hypothetical protein